MTKLPVVQYPKPPAHIAPYVDALGYELAIELFLTFGGSRVCIADDPTDRNALVNVIGFSGVKQLAEVRHLLPDYVPIANPWLARCFRARGM